MSGQIVDIVRLIHDEVGVSTFTIRKQIEAGKLYIDGLEYKGDPKAIPESVIDGKALVVIGPERRFRVRYKSDNNPYPQH